MFERKKYKDFAKKQLKGRWGVPILMSLIVCFFTFLINFKSFYSPDFHIYVSEFINGSISYYEFIEAFNGLSVQTPVSFIFDIFTSIISGILSVACISVYLKMSRSPEKVGFSSFIQGLNLWAKAVLATLWSFLWTFLWSLLFIIPGFVKSIAYSQMYYLIVEYPELSVTKAMKISMLITKGHKADLFVMYLSFLGWIILAAIPAGLGMIVLSPYMDMTFVNAYHALLKEAVETGKLKPEDLSE